MVGSRTSPEMRERIIEWYQDGMSIAEMVALSGRCRRTVYNIIDTFLTYGQASNPNARPAGRKRILERQDTEFLMALLDENHTIFLDELQEQFAAERDIDISLSTLSRTLARLALTRKGITREAAERNELLRAIWQVEIGQYEPRQLVFLDESAVDDQTSARRDGWSPLGRACVCRSTFLRGTKYSILPALSLEGIVALDIFEGSVNRERFLAFLRTQVVCLFILSSL